jgi:glycosyltransferase involved in cell wall biosynthesis
MSGAEINKILQFPFGVDQKLFAGNWSGANSNKIISLRNWEHVHNQRVLLEMLEQHSDEFNEFEFIFIGDGATLVELRNVYKQLEQNGLISFLGVIDNRELIKILPECRLAISTSKSDGTSVSVLEAMSAGTPILASDSSANKEIIKDTKNGFLFENDSSIDLYEILKLILNSTYDLEKISENARIFARDYADWDKNGRNLIREMKIFLN